MFLNVQQNAVMCLECWHHISQFHSYQQSVFEAQRKLLQEKSFMEYQCSIQSTASRENTSCSILIKEEDEASMANLEFMEEFSYCKTLEAVKSEDHFNNTPAYNPEASTNVGIIHNGLHNANEEDPSKDNNAEGLSNVGTNNELHNAIKEDTSIETSYNPEDSENIGTIHNELHNDNEDHSNTTAYNPEDLANINTFHNALPAYNPEDSTNVGIIHNGLHNANEEDPSKDNNAEDLSNVGTNNELHNAIKEDNSIETTYNPEDSENVGTIHNELHNDNEDPSNTTAYNPEDLANINTFHTALQNTNEEEPLIRNASSPEDICNIGTINTELYSIEYEFIDNTAEFSEQSNSAECISLDDASMQSDDNQPINTMESKRTKTQTALNSFVSKWRENLECGQCGILVTSFALLQCHFRQEHPTEQCHIALHKFNTRKLPNPDKPVFKCPKCYLRLSSAASLCNHKCLRNYKPQRKRNRRKLHSKTSFETIEDFIAICKPNLECRICHETCQRFSELKMHFQNNHPNDDFNIMCCQREFIQRSLFKEHVWLHVDPNAFRCKICGSNNSRYRTLQAHMLKIHGKTLETKSIDDIGAEIHRRLNSSVKDNLNQ